MEPNNNPIQNPNQSTGAFPGMTPVSPVTPASAATPVTPTTPMQPNQPIQPLQSTQPIPPTQSMQPAQPIQPAQPMQPASPILSSSAAQPTQPVGAASLDLSTPITTSQPETSSAGDGLIGHSFSVDKSQNDGNSIPSPFNSTSNSSPMTSPLAQSDFGTSFASGIENNNSGSFGGVISSNTNTTNSVAFNDPAKTTSNNQSVSKDGLSRKPKKTSLIVLITVAIVVIIALVVVLVMQMNGGGLSSSIQDGAISDSSEVEDAWEVMKGTLLVCEMKPLEKINDQDVESATVTYLVEDNKITTTSVSLEILDEDGEVGFMKELSSYEGLFMGENIEVDEIIDGDGTLKVDLQVFANRLAELLDGDSRLENVSCTVELT